MIDDIMNAYKNGIKIIKRMGKQAKEAHTENYIINPIFEILGWSAIEERCLPRYSILPFNLHFCLLPFNFSPCPHRFA